MDHPSQAVLLLSSAQPDRAQERSATLIVLAFVLVLILVTPFARTRLDGTEGLLPAYASALLLIEVITGALLLNLYSVHRQTSILALASGYLFSGFMVVPWVLTFPGVFEAFGLSGGLQSTAAVAALRRVGFPIFVLAYILLKDRKVEAKAQAGSTGRAIALNVAALLAAVMLLGWGIIAHDGALPAFMVNTSEIAAGWRYVAETSIILYGACLVLLSRRRHSILDLWLIVVLCTLTGELILMSFISGGIRLSVGWWTGRLYGLAATSIVLLVLLFETTRLYERLTRSLQAERRAREARLTAMEALSASIAHEVNQPIATMVTNADAGLHWLDRDEPELDEARGALTRIVDDGHRAGEIVRGIRNMFAHGARDHVLFDINRLIRDEIVRSEGEASAARVALQPRLEENLPPVTGNPVQFHGVVSNLIRNALDAMIANPDRSHSLAIASARQGSDILVSVADSGPGVGPDTHSRIFEPFFTTKAGGMGMGLMYCRSIIEIHGGRLWVSDNLPRGAVFSFTVPAGSVLDADREG